MRISERHQPRPLGVDGSFSASTSIAGFLAKTGGTVTVTSPEGHILLDAIPVAAGVYTPMPFALPGPGTVVQLGGGASGTLAV